MRLGTVISLGASTFLGIGALLIARLWIPGHGPHPSSAQAAAPHVETVPVVVAAKAIPWGAKLNADYLKVDQLPDTAVPQGAFHSVSQVLNQDGGPPVALTAMSPKEAVLSNKISGPGERMTLAALVGDGMRAYTIAVSASSAGGGHIMPGDRVDVLYARELPTPTDYKPAWTGKLIGTSLLIQDVRVLGMDLNANPTSTEPAVPSTATLEVSVEDAERLSLAVQGGGALSLALRRPGSSEITPPKRFVLNNPGFNPGAPAPGGGDGVGGGEASAARAARASRSHEVRPQAGGEAPGSSVVITNGAAKTEVKVPIEVGL
jgi:pilus assembly protein CpaB